MRSHTVTTVLPAPKREVFGYMAEIENLPEWATEFARELRRDEDGYKRRQQLGRVPVRDPSRRGDRRDRHARRADRRRDGGVPNAGRSNWPDGRTAYSFTMFQDPAMPDELFEGQHESLRREFANIEARFA